MAQSGFAAFLLFLGLVVSNVYGDNATTILCEQILTATLNNASLSDFNFTVSPAVLFNNTDYTVQLNGAGNFTVLLQAVTLSGPVGNWSLATNSCDGSPLFIEYFTNNKLINTTWTSPDNATSVTIKVYIHNDTDTFLLQQTLSQDQPTTPKPSEAQSTASNITIASSTASTQVQKTTSSGPIEQSSLVSMALSVFLGLLLIPNKYLS